MDEKPIVKFQGKFWIVAEKKGEMLVLMRDGRRAIIPEQMVKKYENLTTHSHKEGDK
jgi:hypothetical protein